LPYGRLPLLPPTSAVSSKHVFSEGPAPAGDEVCM
jgi:hypothetical protein